MFNIDRVVGAASSQHLLHAPAITPAPTLVLTSLLGGAGSLFSSPEASREQVFVVLAITMI